MWFGRARREAEQQLEAFRREHRALSERCSRAEAAVEAAQAQLASASAERAADRDAAASQLRTLTNERDNARSAASVRVAEMTAERDAAHGRLAELTAERDELRTLVERTSASAASEPTASSAPTTTSAVDDGCWALLLADLTRRWPVPVTVTVASAAEAGAAGAAGGVETGGAGSQVPDQLAEAFVRELERLREEVGVDAEISVVGTFAPANPVVFLLAALDLLGALTSTCQRVVVKLDDQLDMIGQDFEGRRDELDTARDRSLAAGAVVGPLEIDGERVHMTLSPASAG